MCMSPAPAVLAGVRRWRRSAAVGLIWRMTVAYAWYRHSADRGLVHRPGPCDGMLWGRPMWGTYWEWDPRLTSELLLLFLYTGVTWGCAFEDPARGSRRSAVGHRRGGERADHPLLGDLVEFAPPGPSVMKFGRPTMPAADAGTVAADAGRIHVFWCIAADPFARRTAQPGLPRRWARGEGKV